jgi:hypothetical protein
VKNSFTVILAIQFFALAPLMRLGGRGGLISGKAQNQTTFPLFASEASKKVLHGE